MGYFFRKTLDGQPDRAAIEAALPEMRVHINVLDNAVAETGRLAGASFSSRPSGKRSDAGERQTAHSIF